MTVDPKVYQELAARTECDQERAQKRYSLQAVRLNHSVIGMAGEVGEVASAVERWLHYGRELDRENVIEEYGDLLWYIALGLNALGLDMGDVMKANIAKLKARYPDKYTDQASEHRDKDAERVAVCQAIIAKAYTVPPPPPAVPVLAYKCINCRDTGLVTDEWDTVSPSPCPICKPAESGW